MSGTLKSKKENYELIIYQKNEKIKELQAQLEEKNSIISIQKEKIKNLRNKAEVLMDQAKKLMWDCHNANF